MVGSPASRQGAAKVRGGAGKGRQVVAGRRVRGRQVGDLSARRQPVVGAGGRCAGAQQGAGRWWRAWWSPAWLTEVMDASKGVCNRLPGGGHLWCVSGSAGQRGRRKETE